MNDIVDGAHGCKTAGTEARNALNGEKPVGGHMILGLYARCGIQRLLHIIRLTDMAGSAVADLYNILALFVHGKVFVKGRNAVQLGFAHADLCGNILQRILRQEFVLILHILHDRYGVCFIAVVLLQNAIDKTEIYLYQCVSSFLYILVSSL